MRVAVLGGGASGLLTAWLIQAHHDVTVYEAEQRLGGHAYTVPVDADGERIYAEAGFKYFFDRTNPSLLALFELLDLGITWTDAAMTLLRDDGAGHLVIPPVNVRQLASLLRAPGALRDLICLGALRKAYDEVVAKGDMSLTVQELLAWRRFPRSAHRFLYSFISSSWGAPVEVMAKFPAYNVLTLLSSPHARYKRVGYLDKGSGGYIAAVAERLERAVLRRGCAVRRLERRSDHWAVTSDDEQSYDAVVLAMPPWRAAPLLFGSQRWREALEPFRCFDAHVAVHRDRSFMPSDRRDWTLSNVYRAASREMLTSWEGMRQSRDVFRSWLDPGRVPKDGVCQVDYQHLIVDRDSEAQRSRIESLQGRDQLFAVGMYTGPVDCHESCVTSALAAAQRLAPESVLARQLVASAAARRLDEAQAARRAWSDWLRAR